MKTLAFAASNHSQSINRALVGYAATRLQAIAPQVTVEFIDINDFEMPIYSIDRERNDGIHPLAQALFDKIGAADAVLVSFAEYNGYVTAAWKNIYDWMSRSDSKVWQDKPMVIMAASPGPRAGANVLQPQQFTAPFLGMDIKGQHGVGTWSAAWNGTNLSRDKDIAAIDAALTNLIKGVHDG